MNKIIDAFMQGFRGVSPLRRQCRADQKMRDRLTERQLDRMIDDSFPASDPASTY